MAGTRVQETSGAGEQSVMAHCSKRSGSRAPWRAKPVTAPSSSMPTTTFPPDALARATTCRARSSGLILALLRSK